MLIARSIEEVVQQAGSQEAKSAVENVNMGGKVDFNTTLQGIDKFTHDIAPIFNITLLLLVVFVAIWFYKKKKNARENKKNKKH